MITAQAFSATTTFDGIFGSSVGPFVGGGAQVILPASIFVDLAVTRFRKTGERAFLADGETFRLGLPLTSTVTPIELSGGYRIRRRRHPRLVPYVGAGVGSYAYTETSAFADKVSARHAGFLAVGGLEIRMHRWLALDAGAQYTRIPGVLGVEGISKDVGESDLGGTAFRFRVTVGR